jgi:hypothetical protein
MTKDPDQDRLLAEWTARLADELGLDMLGDAGLDVDGVLRLAAVAAHSIVRPAAPLTTFVVGFAAGLAVGRGALAAEPAIEAASATALAATRDWTARGTTADATGDAEPGTPGAEVADADAAAARVDGDAPGIAGPASGTAATTPDTAGS